MANVCRFKRSRNLPTLINLEQLGYKCRDRAVFSLIRDPEVTYCEAFVVQSKDQPIYLEEDIIFKNCYSVALALFGVNDRPGLIYKHKCETVLRGQKRMKVQIQNILFPPSSPAKYNKDIRCTQIPLQLHLTGENSLRRVNPFTGEVMQSIYLGPKKEDVVYSNLYFDDPNNVVLSSSESSHNAVQRFAIFQPSPLRFFAMFDILQSDFSKDLNEGHITDDMLMTQCGKKKKAVLQFYSLPDILARNPRKCTCDIGQECNRHGRLGHEPYGIQPNVLIKDVPPVLFQVPSELMYNFGGYPYHLIYKKRDGLFAGDMVVADVKTGNISATFRAENIDGFKDSCHFMQDESNRVLLIRGNSITFKCLDEPVEGKFETDLKQIKGKNKTKKRVRPSDIYHQEFKSFCLDFAKKPREQECNQRAHLKREATKKSILPTEYNIFGVEQVANVHILAILHNDTGTSAAFNGVVGLFDNRSGALMDKVPLGFDLQNDIDYQFHFAPDYFAIMENPSGSTKVYKLRIFKLSRRHVDLEIE